MTSIPEDQPPGIMLDEEPLFAVMGTPEGPVLFRWDRVLMMQGFGPNTTQLTFSNSLTLTVSAPIREVLRNVRDAAVSYRESLARAERAAAEASS